MWAGTLALAQPCSTTNGTNCVCPDGTQNCELLPDLMISWYALENDTPVEFSQTGNGADNGRLRVTGSTPNIGYGALTVLGTDYFICGTDTIFDPTRSISMCPDGVTEPTNLLKQRIYSKNGNSVTYTDRWAGGQTFHVGHSHNHVDDWVTFTLRSEDPNEPDTLKWPIIGNGAKIGFCLMDLSNCNGSNGHCRDSHLYGQGNVLTNANLNNFGMGGGNYNCSPVEQGISAGYVDIYDQWLDGMWIDIPPGTCNGDYWIVAEVDPLNHFLESNEDNNWTAIPFTLTQQVPIGNPTASISYAGSPVICNNGSLELTSSAGTSYLWQDGSTSRNITVTQPGSYYVQVSSQCGTAMSDTITVTQTTPNAPSVIGDTICLGQSATLTATGLGTIEWYDSPSAGNLLNTGPTHEVFNLTSPDTLYAVSVENQCPSNSVPVAIAIEEHTGITISGIDAAYLVSDGAVQLTPSISGGFFIGRGITVDGSGSTYFSPTLAGVMDSIKIEYQYTTPAGCTADTAIYVTVLANPGSGVTELGDNRLLFYPNPAQNSLTIALPAGQTDATLTILDATGKIVMETRLPNGVARHMIDVSQFSKGVYLLRVDAATGSRFGKLSKL